MSLNYESYAFSCKKGRISDSKMGKFIGKKARYKRAIVKLASEDSITLFEEE